MANAIAGVGTTFERWSGSAWQFIAEINAIEGPTMDKENIEVTALDTDGGYDEFITGFMEGGTLTLNMNFSRSGYELMKQDFEIDVARDYRITLPDAEDTTLEFEGLVTEIPITMEADNQLTADVTIQVSGEVTIASAGAESSVEIPVESEDESSGSYDAASVALFARMAAAGEAQTDDRKAAIDTAIVALKAAGLFDTKFEAFYLTRGKGEASTKMNWIKDAYNLTKIFAGTLTYTEDVGYNTDGNCLLSTNYKPSTITGLYELDNASFGFKVGGTLTANKGHGAISNAPIRGTLFVVTSNRVNSSDSGGSAYELGYNCVARTNATGFKQYKNAATADVTAASSAKCDTLTFMGLYNEQAASQTYTTATEILEFGFIGAYITQAEFLTIQSIVNAYIAAL